LWGRTTPFYRSAHTKKGGDHDPLVGGAAVWRSVVMYGEGSFSLRGGVGGSIAPTAFYMATVTLKGIKKIYEGGVQAVCDFNLEIADKEFVVLVGPSGCGKSTTLRMVAGLEEISGGELYIGERLVNDIPPKDRDIAMVFQNYALYPHMTVRENMAFALKLKKVPKEEIDKKVNEAAELLGITEYLARKPKALSGGQRQRVAIGRAIVRDPQIMLMDEPLSNLDAKLRNQMRAELIKLRQRINTTFIYVTHDQTEAMTLGDRIVIMKDGVINQVGTPQEVFDCPANIFVAGFIGTPQMNFFENAQLVKNGGMIQIKIQDTVLDLPDEKQAKLKEIVGDGTKSVIAGIRPAHIRLCEADSNAISGVVDVSEMMGSELHIHVSVDGEDVVMVMPTTGLPTAWRGGIPYGTMIQFTTSGELIHIFDPETGKNIFA